MRIAAENKHFIISAKFKTSLIYTMTFRVISRYLATQRLYVDGTQLYKSCSNNAHLLREVYLMLNL